MLLSGCSQNQVGQNVPKKTDNKLALSTPIDVKTTNNTEKAAETMGKEDSFAVKAIRDFYGDTGKTIVIYEQIPFENDCVLILADRFMDGEHYPNLHLVSSTGKVLALTRHSYCWSMNYTQYMGYNIYYGLAAVETRQINNNSKQIKKLEAVFADKAYEAKTRENIIAQINNRENTPRIIKSPHAYILPVKDHDMPDDVAGIYSDGGKVSLSQLSMDSSLNDMPQYFKSNKKSIYNSYAFSYSPMMSPESWKRVDANGETGLKGKTDENGNLNALFLRPSSAVFKTIHSNEFPYDLKSFYLSYNNPWSASFSSGERVEVVYSKDCKLYDCRVFKLNTQSVDKEINVKDFHILSLNKNNQVTLPKEPGYYLLILRTEKYSELHSYMGVVRIN
jgi:hypothetical protein